ncbi:MAG: DUF2917 domain-containing protein [Paenacidovorax caeni]
MAYTALLTSPTAARSRPGSRPCWRPASPCELAVRRGETALVEATQGRVWLTRDGQPQDHILEAGQHLAFAGPARLPPISAEGGGAQPALGQGAGLATPAGAASRPRGRGPAGPRRAPTRWRSGPAPARPGRSPR